MLWGGFILGLLGGFHCIGMCGPIMLALPADKLTTKIVINRILYHFGRILTYIFIGVFFGLAGAGLALAGVQQGLSITVGIFILLALFFSYYKPLSGKGFVIYRLTNRLKVSMGKRIKKNHPLSQFVLGLLNGLLPCGLVYIAALGAASFGFWQGGAIYMGFFGLGTLPLMLILALSGNIISMNLRNRMRKMVPYFVGTMALLLIIRGLDLGIPYISPGIEAGTNMIICH